MTDDQNQTNKFDPSYYQPAAITVKRNAIAGPATLQIVKVLPTDNNEHPFIQITPLIVQQVNILASGAITIGPQGNAVFPLPIYTDFSFSKVDVNSIYYANASGVLVYFMYSGTPELTLESPVTTLPQGIV